MPPGWLAAAPVTRVIIFVNIAVFAAQLLLAHSSKAIVGIPPRSSLAFGSNYGLATLGELRLETLLTSCFLHGGILHIGFNMLILWQSGPLVERSVGAARMATMYLVAGVVGSLASAAYAWIRTADVASLGASGAIMGVLAAAMVLAWRAQGWSGPLTQSIARWLGLNMIIGFVLPSTDNAAHLGGAVAGAIAAALWQRGFRYSASATRAIVAACASVLVACIGVVVFRDVTDPFATITAAQRLAIAESALDDMDCKLAYHSLTRAEKLVRKRPDVVAVRARFDAFCGRPM